MNCTDFVPGNQQQTCKACGRVDRFDFHVDDRTWRRVVPIAFVNRVICLPCFDGFAFERDISYANDVCVLYFAGQQATIVFNVGYAQNTPRGEPS